MDWEIQLFKLNFDHKERDAVTAVVDGGWLTMGKQTARFETNFSNFLGNDVRCVAVSNGTAALHMSLLSFGVGPGDEVVIPALTFAADVNSVTLTGAKPVLADSFSLDNFNLTAETIEKHITSRTKAVIIVHFAGYPCDMPSIVHMCRRRGLKLIEDVAHAPGAKVAGQSCGTWGDVGCFSFFSNKNLSIGEGGMVTSCNPELVERLRYLRSHGMTSLTLDRHKGRAITYDVVVPGLNYRLDELRAAIGLVQLEKLPAGNAHRKALTERYRSNLLGSPVSTPFSQMPFDHESVYHIMPILLPVGCERKLVIDSLKAKGIQSSIHYPPFWSFSAYKDQFLAADTPVASEICERELTLPLFPTMTDEEVDLVTLELLNAIV
ncbi:MAG: DegT/DnrJ/EryC1/StrS family aminotransferase [Kordiimonadaceae bacterium]|jgi:dTDP-4-amino-4,6-dideoxygalactose transaminase|nr:DegT/DnrJ/EryC1/StrS family aminotransferase [Kordiimonadaceae bacterium]